MDDKLELLDGQLALWLVPLVQEDDCVRQCYRDLVAAEQARAKRFSTEILSSKYIVAHAALRQILSRYFDVSPSAVDIAVQPFGKPYCPDQNIMFNLSHCKKWAVIGLIRDQEIGVDIEEMSRKINPLELTQRFFTAAELEWLMGFCSEREQREAFLQLWTIKEAVLKYTGMGLSQELSSFEVTRDVSGHWLMSVVGASADEQPTLHIFSQERLLGDDFHILSAVVTNTPAEVDLREWEFC